MLFGLALTGAACAAGDELESLLQREVIGPSRYAQSRLDAPTSVQVFTASEAAALGHWTVAEMLGRLPGVHLSHSRQYIEVGLRGLNRPGDFNARLLVAIDGVRVNEPVYDQALPDLEFPLVPEWVKRLELVYGPSSSVYGANALLGVVNVVTVDGADAPGLRLKAATGSFGTRRMVLQYGRPGEERGGAMSDFFVGLQSMHSEGETLDLPELGLGAPLRGRDGVNHHSLFAKYRSGSWRLSGTWTQRDKDVATAPYGTVPGLPGTRYRDRYGHLEWAYEEDWSKALRRSFRLSASRYDFTGDYQYEGDLRNRDEAASLSYNLDARVQWRGWLNHEMQVGVDARHVPWAVQRNFDVGGATDSYLDTTARSARVGLFAQDQWRWSAQWQLTTGVRVDRLQGQATQWSPRFALVWRPSANEAIKLMAGRAFRAPNLGERLYSDGYSQMANPALQPERLRSLEFGWERAVDSRTVFSLMAYAMRLGQVIELQAVPESDFVQYRNVHGISSRGLDIGLAQQPGAGIGWRIDASLLQARRGEQRLSNSPRWLLKGHAIWPIAEGWTLALEAQAQGRRLGPTEVPWQWSANARVGFEWGAHRLGLRALNLTDRQLYDPAGPDNEALMRVPQPRRSIRMEWQWSL